MLDTSRRIEPGLTHGSSTFSWGFSSSLISCCRNLISALYSFTKAFFLRFMSSTSLQRLKTFVSVSVHVVFVSVILEFVYVRFLGNSLVKREVQLPVFMLFHVNFSGFDHLPEYSEDLFFVGFFRHKSGGLGGTRTLNQRLKRALLYH